MSKGGAAYLAQQSQYLEAPTVDLELWRSGEAHHAVRERVHYIEEV